MKTLLYCLISIVAFHSLASFGAHALLENENTEPGKGGAAVCAKYDPGDTAEYAKFKALVEKLGNASFEGFEEKNPLRLKDLQALNSSTDLRSTQALYEVFSNANDKDTRVFYAGYTQIGGRQGSKDGGEGFRVIWQRTVGKEPDRRLISVITFWTYNKESKKFQLVGGPDSIRVRAEAGPILKKEGFSAKTQFTALSYEATLDKGAVKSLAPGVYFEDGGALKKGLGDQVHPRNCTGCHYEGSQTRIDGTGHIPIKGKWDSFDFKDLVVDEAKLVPTKEGYDPISQFMNAVPATGEHRNQLIESFTRPRQTFLPEGIVAALNQRCRDLTR